MNSSQDPIFWLQPGFAIFPIANQLEYEPDLLTRFQTDWNCVKIIKANGARAGAAAIKNWLAPNDGIFT